MTIGTILPDIVAACGLVIDDVSVSNNEPHMRQIVSMMNQAGQDIVKRAEWSQGYRTVELDANLEEVSLPTNYYKMAETGAVFLLDGGGFVPVRLVSTPSTFEFAKQNESAQNFAHIANQKLYFWPGTGQLGAKFVYVTRGWIQGDGTKEFVTSDDDQPIFPESLLLSAVAWRWQRQNGLPYEDYVAEFEANFVAAINADRGII